MSGEAQNHLTYSGNLGAYVNNLAGAVDQLLILNQFQEPYYAKINLTDLRCCNIVFFGMTMTRVFLKVGLQGQFERPCI